MNCREFHGWWFLCPFCQKDEYVDSDELPSDPEDGQMHVCGHCQKSYEINMGD